MRHLVEAPLWEGPEAHEPIALRLAQAAQAIGVSPRTLWSWAKQGLVPCCRIGGTVLFPVHLLKKWLEESAVGGKGGGA